MNLFFDRATRVAALESAIFSLADRLEPVVSLSRIYVDGLDRLPRDGRFLLVGNHTMAGWPEIVMIPYFVHAELGVRVRGLATRQLADMRGPGREIAEAAGAVVGDPAQAADLMRRGETVLVFPGGAGHAQVQGRGVPPPLAGPQRLRPAGDRSRLPRRARRPRRRRRRVLQYRRARRSLGADDPGIGERLHGVSGVDVPLMRGVGPTLAPRPQRMYLRFGEPITTTMPTDATAQSWEQAVKQTTQNALETILDEVRALRSEDPFRRLNPLAWRHAIQPPVHTA